MRIAESSAGARPASYCSVSDCEDLAYRDCDGRPLCNTHRQQLKRTGLVGAVEERGLTLIERVIAAAGELAEAPDDDPEYERRRRRLLTACAELGREQVSRLVTQGQRAARRRGVQLGRPPRVPPEKVRAILKRTRSVQATAEQLGVSRWTVQRALRSERR